MNLLFKLKIYVLLFISNVRVLKNKFRKSVYGFPCMTSKMQLNLWEWQDTEYHTPSIMVAKMVQLSGVNQIFGKTYAKSGVRGANRDLVNLYACLCCFFYYYIFKLKSYTSSSLF